jgi:hypothetical protein
MLQTAASLTCFAHAQSNVESLINNLKSLGSARLFTVNRQEYLTVLNYVVVSLAESATQC